MITLKFKNKPSCWAADEKMIKVDIDPARQKFNVKFRKENNFTSGYKVLNFEEKNCNGNFVEAINNAGIFNFPSFGGSGDNKFVLESLCKMLRIKKYQIVEIFG